MRKERKRLWRHWKRAVRGDEARRQGQLTRLMSSPFPATLRCPIHFLSLSLSPQVSSPSFLTNHPPFNPPAITLRPSCVPLLPLATSSASPPSSFSFYFSSPPLVALNLIVTHELPIYWTLMNLLCLMRLYTQSNERYSLIVIDVGKLRWKIIKLNINYIYRMSQNSEIKLKQKSS